MAVLAHPETILKLRYMARELNPGYDIFDSIMNARQVQAESMAIRPVECNCKRLSHC